LLVSKISRIFHSKDVLVWRAKSVILLRESISESMRILGIALHRDSPLLLKATICEFIATNQVIKLQRLRQSTVSSNEIS
ncbi:MAG: hypothetical protein JXB24_06320, partial [Bacteroidales bacterium]|nr:hypothetical protein [Bacteroidales bacterium]